MRNTPTACSLFAACALAGCLASEITADRTGVATSRPALVETSMVLLSKAEGEDFGEILVPNLFDAEGRKPTPPAPLEKKGGMALKLGAGLAMPGSESIGSAPDREIASYSDVLANGPTFEASAEFGSGTVRVYGEAAYSSFEGQAWTNPDNSADSWLSSDMTVTAIIGGARFVMGPAYAKAGVGVAMFSEMSRVDNFTGTSHVILDDSSPAAFVLGGGAELRIGKARMYADLEWMMAAGASDAATEDAMLHWPQFEEGSGMSVTTMRAGMSLSF